LEFKQYVRVIANELSYLGLKESEPSDFLIDFRLSSPASVGERMQPYTTPYTRVNCIRDVYHVCQLGSFYIKTKKLPAKRSNFEK
jgi:hypothetical protein